MFPCLTITNSGQCQNSSACLKRALRYIPVKPPLCLHIECFSFVHSDSFPISRNIDPISQKKPILAPTHRVLSTTKNQVSSAQWSHEWCKWLDTISSFTPSYSKALEDTCLYVYSFAKSSK